jgi:hypothetical protein
MKLKYFFLAAIAATLGSLVPSSSADVITDSNLITVNTTRVAPVPEPTTFAVLAGGFGILALVNLRRKKL